MTQNFHETSYRLHIAHTRNTTDSRKKADRLPSIIASPQSIDALRHERMYEFLRPLVDSFPLGAWMTIGDTGADAYWLRECGVRKITATSLSCEEINFLKEKGLLNTVDVIAVNAECIDLPDDSVDLILCKNTYHHLPRAPIAFYELLRVSRKAVVFIEPAEQKGFRFLDYLRKYIKFMLRNQTMRKQLFEKSGNFIYSLSENEVRRQATAIQLDAMAFKYFNDFYYPKLAARPKAQKSAMFLFKLGVGVQDILCAAKLMNFGQIALVVFKNRVDENIDVALKLKGYKLEYLPQNPFI